MSTGSSDAKHPSSNPCRLCTNPQDPQLWCVEHECYSADNEKCSGWMAVALTSKENALVEGEKFTTAWLNIDKFPGGMMMSSHGGRFGPVPAMTGCLITTSATTVEEWRLKGMSVIEVQLRNAPETYERRLAEACERMRRAAALVAMAGDQSMALAIYDHSRRLLGDVPPWWDSENAQKAGACPPIDAKLNASIEAVAKVLQEEAASDPTFPVRGVANYAGLAGRIIRAVAGSKEKS